MVLLENGVKMNRISSHPVLDQKDNNKNVIFTFDGKKMAYYQNGGLVKEADKKGKIGSGKPLFALHSLSHAHKYLRQYNARVTPGT